MLVRVGRFGFLHPWRMIAIWIAALFGVIGIVGAVGDDFDESFEIPGSEATRGLDVLDEHFESGVSGLRGTIVFRTDAGVDDPDVMAAMEALFEEIDAIEGVEVDSPYADRGSLQIAWQGELAGKVAYADVNLDREMSQQDATAVGEEIRELTPDIEGLQLEIGGSALAGFEPPETELIGLAFAVVVLIVAFGSVLAMGLPIGVALAGVGTGIGIMMLLSHVLTVPTFATSLGAMIGLGVGIDYALFIVTRYREGLHAGHDRETSLVHAMDTAGRAVVFAGLTVVISLLGMVMIGLAFTSGLGITAGAVVLVTMLASISLLPAFIGLAAHRIELTRYRGLIAAGFLAIGLLGVGLGEPIVFLIAIVLIALTLLLGFIAAPLKKEVVRKPPKPIRETFAYKWSRFVQHRPWTIAIIGTALLLLVSAPLLGLRMGFSDESNLGEETTTRKAYDLLSEAFGPGFNGPVLVVAEINSDADLATFENVRTLIAADPGVASMSPPIGNDFFEPTAQFFQFIPTTSPQDEATTELVNRLRSEVLPPLLDSSTIEVSITGFIANQIDVTDYLSVRTPLFFVVVLGLSFLLLMGVFRSVLVPLKAVIMNLLSISAAYGIVIAVFQWAWLGDLTGLEPAPIEPFLPMMLFAIVFGLSMDYEVFLLSRVKEEFDRTGDPVNSVADGLASTARVITVAAAIMVVVFASFFLESNRTIKLFGLGLASAVFIDATFVRMLIVPATMELLGARNWWMPKWLDRLVPNITVERSPEDLEGAEGDEGDAEKELVSGSV